eukprot:gene6574-13302_t
MNPRRSQLDVDPKDDSRCSPSSLDSVLSAYNSNLILYKSNNFCIINKPPDIRMNGDFDITVEKLILNILPDITLSDIKWVHQLDYATSGVLCIGLHKDAGFLASTAFQNRTTRKEYMAILHGHLYEDKFPILTEKPVSRTASHTSVNNNQFSSMQTNPNKSNENELTWQEKIMKINLHNFYLGLQKLIILHKGIINSTHTLPSPPPPPTSSSTSTSTLQDKFELLKSLCSYSIETFEKDSKLRKKLRKCIKLFDVDIELLESNHTTLSITESTSESTSASDSMLKSISVTQSTSLSNIVVPNLDPSTERNHLITTTNINNNTNNNTNTNDDETAAVNLINSTLVHIYRYIHPTKQQQDQDQEHSSQTTQPVLTLTIEAPLVERSDDFRVSGWFRSRDADISCGYTV